MELCCCLTCFLIIVKKEICVYGFVCVTETIIKSCFSSLPSFSSPSLAFGGTYLFFFFSFLHDTCRSLLVVIPSPPSRAGMTFPLARCMGGSFLTIGLSCKQLCMVFICKVKRLLWSYLTLRSRDFILFATFDHPFLLSYSLSKGTLYASELCYHFAYCRLSFASRSCRMFIGLPYDGSI